MTKIITRFPLGDAALGRHVPADLSSLMTTLGKSDPFVPVFPGWPHVSPDVSCADCRLRSRSPKLLGGGASLTLGSHCLYGRAGAFECIHNTCAFLLQIGVRGVQQIVADPEHELRLLDLIGVGRGAIMPYLAYLQDWAHGLYGSELGVYEQFPCGDQVEGDPRPSGIVFNVDQTDQTLWLPEESGLQAYSFDVGAVPACAEVAGAKDENQRRTVSALLYLLMAGGARRLGGPGMPIIVV